MRGFIAGIVVMALPLMAAASPATGSIQGSADPGAQVIVTNLDDGALSGVMAKCDGTYVAPGLRPGRYKVQENGPGHAARTLSVSADHISQTDLAPQRRTNCAKG